MITRQHNETEITEIMGKACQSILAVEGITKNSIDLIYTSFENVWLRVFMDADVLFVDTCDGPDRDDDLDERAEYKDLAMTYDLKGEEVCKALMKNGIFQLGFKCGIVLVFEQHDGETILRVVK